MSSWDELYDDIEGAAKVRRSLVSACADSGDPLVNGMLYLDSEYGMFLSSLDYDPDFSDIDLEIF